jgi:hypothetical protein
MHKPLSLILTVAAFALTACSSPFWKQQVSMTPQTLNGQWLDYVGYRGEQTFGPWLVTREGGYEYRTTPGAAPIKLKVVGPNAFGDLNGDGREDAAVILAQDLGGSGTFMTLAAVLSDQGIPRYQAGTNLGDRVKVEAVSIKGGVILVTLVGHGPDDPMCCPTQKVTRSFRLEGNKLPEIAATPAVAAAR